MPCPRAILCHHALVALTPCRQAAARLAAIAGIFVAGSCTTPTNPWAFNTPPSASGGDYAAPEESGRRIVVLGYFDSPRRTPLREWDPIGPGMSEALARGAFNEGTFEIRVDDELARKVRRLADRPRKERLEAIEKIRAEHASLRFVVYGSVTDFTHTTEVPRSVRRRGFIGRRRDAVVAIQLRVFDLEVGREIATDHVVGDAPAPRTDVKKMYKDIDFGSYIFWDSPLGAAADRALAQALQMINRVIPAGEDVVRIVERTASRRVELSAGENAGLVRGHRYYVCTFPPDRPTVAVPVRDRDTGEPIVAHIGHVSRDRASALLLGRPPEMDLRGAVLRTVLPPPPAESPVEFAGAASGGGDGR